MTRTTHRLLCRLLVLAAFALTGPGCGQDDVFPAQLEEGHPGFKQQRCETCHTLPETDHVAERSQECAMCHGGNGACDPTLSNMPHESTAKCVECHDIQHEYDQNWACASCHFAAAGTRDCSPDD